MPVTVSVLAAADRTTIWRLLTDIDRWPEWNPACASAWAEGDATVTGTRLHLQLRHPRGRLFWTQPRVTEVREFERYAFTTRALGFRAPTRIDLADHDEGTAIRLTSESSGLLAFTYRMTFPEKVQGQLWSGALTGLARRVRGDAPEPGTS